MPARRETRSATDRPMSLALTSYDATLSITPQVILDFDRLSKPDLLKGQTHWILKRVLTFRIGSTVRFQQMNDLLVTSGSGEFQRRAPFGIASINVHALAYQKTNHCQVPAPSCAMKGIWPAVHVGRLARGSREVSSTMLADLRLCLHQFSAERALLSIR